MPMPGDEQLCRAPFSRAPHQCLMRSDHPLAEAGRLDRDAYLAAGHILVSNRRRGEGLADMTLRRLGLARAVRFRTSHYFSALDVARRSDLILTTPLTGPPPEGLAALPCPFELEPQDLMLYWHRSADDDPANQWLRGLVLSTE